ncbi:response regulator transcription factor [Paenibacillus eucommiae]|nr:response regulator transcription factor [Paenibacillus eucommiae]
MTTSKRILYIEDDHEIGSWVKDDLEGRGYAIEWLYTGDNAAAKVHQADIVILDVMLPGLDGFTVGQRLKKESPSTPILMLSARTSVEDKLQGLHFADDYLTKPFHPEELAARLEVLLRRQGSAGNSGSAGITGSSGINGGSRMIGGGTSREVKLGHITVNLDHNTLLDHRTDSEIILTGKQHHILMYFLQHSNRILTKEQIYEAVWGESFMEGDKTLMVHIRHLREKIELDPSDPVIIETIRGLGYRVKQ